MQVSQIGKLEEVINQISLTNLFPSVGGAAAALPELAGPCFVALQIVRYSQNIDSRRFGNFAILSQNFIF